MTIIVNALNLHLELPSGEKLLVTVAYNKAMDMLSVGWCKKLRDANWFAPAVYEDVATVTADNLPGCIMNSVQLLKNSSTGEICGLQLLPISRFPELPRGSESLYSYLHLLEDTKGFEATYGLRDMLGMGEDFLKAIRLGVTIQKHEPATAG